MAVVYRCPQCRQKFKWDITRSEPTECHAEQPCGYSYREPPIDADGNDVIEMPSFLSAKSRNNDAVARQIMDGSEQRVQYGAALAGCSPEDMSNLKITNLTDDRAPGQSAIPPISISSEMANAMNNPLVQQQMLHNPNAGAGYAQATSQGQFPNAGARMQRVLRNNHQEIVGRSVRGKNEHGQVVAPSIDVMSDRPTIEFVDPRRGYRPRI